MPEESFVYGQGISSYSSMERRSSTRSATPPTSLEAPISPPHGRTNVNESTHKSRDKCCESTQSFETQPHPARDLAAIEAGEAVIREHLKYFSEHLKQAAKTSPAPPLSIPHFVQLYQRNQHIQGHHFVVHQHDHPVAGVISADQIVSPGKY